MTCTITWSSLLNSNVAYSSLLFQFITNANLRCANPFFLINEGVKICRIYQIIVLNSRLNITAVMGIIHPFSLDMY